MEADKKNKPKTIKKILINISDTRYDVVKKVAQR